MSKSLALKYRPRRFQDVVGQKLPRLVLQRMITTDAIRAGYLFYGSFGSGKTSMARIFAAALNCEHDDVKERPCGVCQTCELTAEGRFPDVTEIDAASSGGVDDIRSLRERARYVAQCRYRVFVLDEVHSLSDSGFDALLKILEEPPPNVVFILVTTDYAKIKDTIVSRCFSCEFTRIMDSQLTERIRDISSAEGFNFTSELCSSIATRARGIARNAVMLAEQAALVGVRTPDQLAQLLGVEDYGIAIVRALASGPDYPLAFEAAHGALAALPGPREVVAAVVTTLRRLLVLTLSTSGDSLSPPPTEAECTLASGLDSVRCVSALRVIWEYLRSIAPVADAYAAMDLVVTLLGQALSSGANSSRSKKLSSQELSAMVRT